MPYRIELLEGPQEGESYPIDPVHGALLGRSPSNNVFLRDRSVSRAHCQIRINEQDRCVVEDLGSTNGTFVNGERVTEKALEDGDVAQVGFSKFRVVRFEEDVVSDTTEFVSGDSEEDSPSDTTSFVTGEDMEE